MQKGVRLSVEQSGQGVVGPNLTSTQWLCISSWIYSFLAKISFEEMILVLFKEENKNDWKHKLIVLLIKKLEIQRNERTFAAPWSGMVAVRSILDSLAPMAFDLKSAVSFSIFRKIGLLLFRNHWSWLSIIQPALTVPIILSVQRLLLGVGLSAKTEKSPRQTRTVGHPIRKPWCLDVSLPTTLGFVARNPG